MASWPCFGNLSQAILQAVELIAPPFLLGSCHWMFISFALLNVIVTVLILFFVTLAMFVIAKFNLVQGTPETKKLLETKENLAPIKAICILAMAAAFYALFVAWSHFSSEGWVCLVLAVLGIIFVGDLIRKKRFPDPKAKSKRKIKEKNVASWEPDETKPWCWHCQEHTRPNGKNGCSNCRGSYYRMNVPIGDRKAGYGCAGCAVVPLLLTLCSLMFIANSQAMLAIVALAVVWFLLVVGFPIVFIYRYRTWMKWARRRRQYPYGTDPKDLEEEKPPPVDKRDGFLSDEDL